MNCLHVTILFTVKQKMSPDFDSEVATTSLRVSLMCPVCYTLPVYIMIIGYVFV